MKSDREHVEWRKIHNEELNGLYRSPNIVRVIKSRIMKWAGRVARMVDRRVLHRVWCGNLNERSHLGERGVDGEIIIRCIFGK